MAQEIQISDGLIARYFPRMRDLRRAILEKAEELEIVEILAQAYAINELRISDRVKEKISQYFLTLEET